MKKINYYWINDRELSVNGETMLPEEACRKYPENAKELLDFVASKTLNTRMLDYDNLFIRDLVAEEKALKNKSATCDGKTIEELIAAINEKVDSIFRSLGIEKKADTISKQKDDAFKLFRYVVKHSTYDAKLMAEKAKDMEDEKRNNNELNALRNAEIKEIYRCLIQGRSICTSDAATLSLLYRRYGLESQHLTIANKNSEGTGAHQITSVKIGGKNYLSDVTLVRSSYESGIVKDIIPFFALFEPETLFNKIYGGTKEIKCAFAPIFIEPTANKENATKRSHSIMDFPKTALKKLFSNEKDLSDLL